MPSGARAPRLAALVTAWLASVVVLCAPFPDAAAWPFSRLSACALPWVALAGVPWPRSRSTHDPALRTAVLWGAAALGPLGVAARLDQLDGLAFPWIAAAGLEALLLTFLLALAAVRAEGGPLHAVLWAVLVPLPPLLAGVLALFAAPTAPTLAWAGWSPIGWAWRSAADPAAWVGVAAWGVPVAVAGLLGLAVPRARRAGAAEGT